MVGDQVTIAGTVVAVNGKYTTIRTSGGDLGDIDASIVVVVAAVPRPAPATVTSGETVTTDNTSQAQGS